MVRSQPPAISGKSWRVPTRVDFEAVSGGDGWEHYGSNFVNASRSPTQFVYRSAIRYPKKLGQTEMMGGMMIAAGN